MEKVEESEKLNYLISMFNQANTTVALLCNHQKIISKTFDKITLRIKYLKKFKNY